MNKGFWLLGLVLIISLAILGVYMVNPEKISFGPEENKGILESGLNLDYNGYIIEFKEKSLIEKKTELEESNKNVESISILYNAGFGWRNAQSGSATIWGWNDLSTGQAYSNAELSVISTDDSDFVGTKIPTGRYVPMKTGHLIGFNIPETALEISSLSFNVKFSLSCPTACMGNNADTIGIYIGDFNSMKWIPLSAKQLKVSVAGESAKYSLNGIVNSDIEKYVSNGKVYLMVFANGTTAKGIGGAVNGFSQKMYFASLNVEKKKLNVDVASELQRQLFLIDSEHASFKMGVESALGKRVSESEGDGIKILGEYKDVLNGIALDLSEDEIAKIVGLPEIKRIGLNLMVNAILMDSVPLINADDVWQLDKDGNNCQISGQECITGKGVKIAIIDTGVDYTHSDLNNNEVIVEPRDYTKINQVELDRVESDPIMWYDDRYEEQKISVNNNRIAYYSKNVLYVYSFDTQSTFSKTLPDSLSVLKVYLNGNYLAYVARDNSFNAYLYVYNLATDNNILVKQIDTIYWSIAIAADKLYYIDRSQISPEYQIWEFNILTGTKRELRGNLAPMTLVASGDNIIYGDFVDLDTLCYDKMIIYNARTGERKEFIPPEAGQLIDFENDEILYVACYNGAYADRWSRYYLYNIASGTYKKISSASQSFSSASQSFGGAVVAAGGYGTASLFNDGVIGKDVVYFYKDMDAHDIYAYDRANERYVLINLIKQSLDLDGENNKVCFLASDSNIYCHDYESAYNYPLMDFAFSKVIGGYDFVNNDNNPIDDHGHGTHVAATAAGNGVLKGVAPDANILAYKVLDYMGRGTFANVISAIEKSVSDGANIISMSLGANCGGTYSINCGPDDAVSRSIDNAVDSGIIAVIAAGNSGPGEGTILSPGTARKAITVGATDKNDVIASFSSRGPVVYNNEIIIKPDIVAPGASICAAEWDSAWSYFGLRCVDNKHIAISGTSMAAPHVSGAAALIKQAYPYWMPLEIKNALKKTAVDIGVDIYAQGDGRIDALAAIASNCVRCTDIDGNGYVTPTDAIVVINRIGICSDSVGYHVKYDINDNGCINRDDATCVISDLGQTKAC